MHVRPWMRLTLPFAIILMILMFILLPVNFMITGKWNYVDIDKKDLILNWLRELESISIK